MTDGKGKRESPGWGVVDKRDGLGALALVTDSSDGVIDAAVYVAEFNGNWFWNELENWKKQHCNNLFELLQSNKHKWNEQKWNGMVVVEDEDDGCILG